MAQGEESGRRQVVNDPLARNPRENAPDRSLQISAVRAPAVNIDSVQSPLRGISEALGKVQTVMRSQATEAMEKEIADGKAAYLSGVTEQELIKTGSRYTMQGYNSLKVVDNVNRWSLTKETDLTNGDAELSETDYAAKLNKERDVMLSGVSDPDERKLLIGALSDKNASLMQKHLLGRNELGRQKRIAAFEDTLDSTSSASTTASKKLNAHSSLAVSPQPVGRVLTPSAYDRDIAIRTIIGEAANEGELGQAAVAHVLVNRTSDGRWPTSIAGVALQKKQFSAWNSGPGGNDLVRKYGPGDALYEKVGKVFDIVASGKHVDPTNGATHYYSPGGMKALVAAGSQANLVPTWAKNTEGESGGSVTIGGHIFSGRSANKAGVVQGNTTPVNPDTVAGLGGDDPAKLRADADYYEKTNPAAAKQFRDRADAAEKAAQGSNKPGQIVSRPIGPPEATEGAGGLAGVSVPTYEDATSWAMTALTGDTNSRLNAAAVKEGVAKTASVPKGPNEVQELLAGFAGLNAKDKASAVSRVMRRQLDSGNDQLFRDAGGIGVLQRLGADVSEIDAVLKARERFEKKQDAKYDEDNELWRNDILKRAGTGESLKAITSDIKKRVDEGRFSDAEAKSLARAAAEAVRSADTKGNSKLYDSTFLTNLGGLYMQIKSGKLGFEDAVKQAKELSTKFNAPEADVQKITQRMFEIDQARQSELLTTAKTAAKKYEANEELKRQVKESINRGYGLSAVTGTISAVVDGEKDISAQQYGVAAIKDAVIRKYMDLAEKGQISKADAVAKMTIEAYQIMQKHGVVDQELQSQIKGALSGSIIGEDKQINPRAAQAYDTYQILRKSGQLNDAYLSKLIGDDYSRLLLEQAYQMDQGNLSSEQSLMKAHDILNDPNRDPQRKLDKDVQFKINRDKAIKEVSNEMTRPGWFDAVVGNFDSAERERFSRTGKPMMERYIQQRADAYYLQYPNADGSVAVELAKQDLKKNMTHVAGNAIISNVPLKEQMGLQGFPKADVNDVFQEFMQTYGDKMFKVDGSKTNVFVEAAGKALGKTWSSPLDWATDLSGGMHRRVPLYVQYNPQNNTFAIDVYKDEAKGETYGQTQYIRADEMGAWYAKKQNTPTGWDKMWSNVFGGAGSAVRATESALGTSKRTANARAAGEAAGRAVSGISTEVTEQ